MLRVDFYKNLHLVLIIGRDCDHCLVFFNEKGDIDENDWTWYGCKMFYQGFFMFSFSRISSLFLASCFISKLFSAEIEPHVFKQESFFWGTGPLLAPTPYTVPAGHVNIEPYLSFTSFSGFYNEHWKYKSTPNFYATTLQIPVRVGLNSFMEFFCLPQCSYQSTKGISSTQVKDLPLVLGFQLVKAVPSRWYPGIKLSLLVSAPIGKYKQLNPSKLFTDAAGSGSWSPEAALTFGKIFSLPQNHVLSTRFTIDYTITTSVRVKGLNSYGGAPTAKGTVYPGNLLNFDLNFEYNFTRNWVGALDIHYTHINKTTFSGYMPLGAPALASAVVAPVGPSVESFSLAPALEYNFNSNIGLIGGVWFSVAGRNAVTFTSGVLALNIYI